MPPAPWLLYSPAHVVHYVRDHNGLSQLAELSGVRLEHLEYLVGLRIKYERNATGETYAANVVQRKGWMLFSNASWIVREDDPNKTVCIGADLKFFVKSMALTREERDMAFFKPERLGLFLAKQLFNSGELVTVYKGRGKVKGWKLTAPPEDPLSHVVVMQPPSAFALPSAQPARLCACCALRLIL